MESPVAKENGRAVGRFVDRKCACVCLAPPPRLQRSCVYQLLELRVRGACVRSRACVVGVQLLWAGALPRARVP